MKHLRPSAVVLAIGFTLSVGVMAETITKKQYKSLQSNLGTQYKVAKVRCKKMKGHDKKICLATIKGKKKVVKAQLDDTYNPNAQTWYKERIAKAEATYAVAIQVCDTKIGNDKEVCIKEAKAAQTQEESYAKAQLKTSKADATAIEKSSAAHKDAETDTRDANYAVAKQKCEALDGDAEDLCLKNAKIEFGEP
ncbi:hypothetical protein [Crenothrix polyspora]|uniref:Uncharacterized protein n=1 Tax=Crenothrix polyspora TaxID=360316 RepID=A0A1R4H0L8_9GAMM|nr:hypothetical protein [Crenothrix polyspora]SJM89755.1 conserved hypothetical protein [Crenothrix polyspora]